MGIESFRCAVWSESSVGLTPNRFAETSVESTRFLSLHPKVVHDTQFLFEFLAIEIDGCTDVDERCDVLSYSVSGRVFIERSVAVGAKCDVDPHKELQ